MRARYGFNTENKNWSKVGTSDRLLAAHFWQAMNWLSPSPLWVDFTPTPASKITSGCQMSACQGLCIPYSANLFTAQASRCTHSRLPMDYGTASAHFNTEHLWSNKSPYVSNIWQSANSKYFTHQTKDMFCMCKNILKLTVLVQCSK